MKYLRTFEIVNQDKPKIGDYVIVNMSNSSNDKGKQFIKTHVGKIVGNSYDDEHFLIHYDVDFNTCGFTKSHFQFLNDKDGRRYILKKDITHWSDDKEELENIINLPKYLLYLHSLFLYRLKYYYEHSIKDGSLHN